MELFLSQILIIKGDNKSFFTISVPGETDRHFASVNETGHSDWLPFYGSAWFALTDKAKKVWKGDTKEIDGVLCGKVFSDIK